MDGGRTVAELLLDGQVIGTATVTRTPRQKSVPNLRGTGPVGSMRSASPVRGSATSMDLPKGSQPSFAFGPYEVELPSGQLSKGGTRVKIQDLPLRLLSVLAEKQ